MAGTLDITCMSAFAFGSGSAAAGSAAAGPAAMRPAAAGPAAAEQCP